MLVSLVLVVLDRCKMPLCLLDGQWSSPLSHNYIILEDEYSALGIYGVAAKAV
jgi:hypothetical protein